MAAYTAAGAAARAAAATLASLEKVTAMYTSTRQYYMLDDLAETSTQAKRVRAGLLRCTLCWSGSARRVCVAGLAAHASACLRTNCLPSLGVRFVHTTLVLQRL